jgi:hypothetical protein
MATIKSKRKDKRRAKQARPEWLKNHNVRNRVRVSVLPDAPASSPNRPDGPLPRLVSKTEVMSMVGASFPTLWAWNAHRKVPALAGGRRSREMVRG